MMHVVKSDFFQEKSVLPTSNNLEGNNAYVKFWFLYVTLYGWEISKKMAGICKMFQDIYCKLR